MLEVGHIINYTADGLPGPHSQRLIVTLADAVRRRVGCYTSNRDFLSFDIDYDEKNPARCQVVAKVIEEWPLVQAKGNKSFGCVLAISRTVYSQRSEEVGPGPAQQYLVRHVDWAVLDVLASAPTIYFNPALGLQIGEVLQIHHEGGSSSRVNIPPAFLTFAQILERNKKAAAPPKSEEKTAYDMILEDDFGDE